MYTEGTIIFSDPYVYTYKNNDKHNGEWNEGIKEGNGIYYFSDGNKYDGMWKNDVRNGEGIFYINGENKKCKYDNGNFVKYI